MQPYLFPYIGYFQLINAVDQFVIHDDVQYTKGGWINRNRILFNGKEYLFTLSVKKNSSCKNINRRFFSDKFESQKKKLLEILKQAYKKAPYFKESNNLINEIFSFKDLNVSNMNMYSLKKICQYLDIITPFVLSSELKKNNNLKGEERVININQVMEATHYINPIGGAELYQKKKFSVKGIELFFLKPDEIYYRQFENRFTPWLSIIDLCMFNSKSKIRTFLNAYKLN